MHGLLFEKNLNLLHPRMFCAKFGWNCLIGSQEKAFWELSTYFYYFPIISPWKGVDLSLWKLESPSPKDMFCAKFGSIWLVILEKMNMWKVYRWMDRQLDGWQPIRKSYLSFQLRYRWANKNHKIQQINSLGQNKVNI